MARCPAGHESQASDYCDTCGLVIGGEASATSSSAAPLAAAVASASAPAPAAPALGGAGCPVCQAERNGRFCEECGYDFDLAEAMPQVMMSPGVLPAEPEPAPVSFSAPAPVPFAEQHQHQHQHQQQPAATEAPTEQGLDLDAELARAEAEAAQSVAATAAFEPATSANLAATAVIEAPSALATDPTAAEPEPEPESEPGSESGSGLELESELGSDLASELGSGSGLGAVATSGGISSFSGLTASGLLSEELTLVVDADPGYYKAQVERGDIIESEFPFPKYSHERRFSFADGPVRIGRASASRGLNPEIDLTGPPLDPAVSHLHAQLLRHDEGWVVVDLDSANGTRLNDAQEPLEAETEIPVKQGDRIHLGVWTTITVQ